MSRRTRTSGTMRRTRSAAIAATIAAVVLVVLGIEPFHVLALLALAITVAAMWNTAPDTSVVELAPPPGWNRSGTRRDLSQLAWSVHGRDRRIGERVARLLHELATDALAGHGVTLTDPAQQAQARTLLGPHVHTALTDTDRMPTPRTAATIMTAIEHLDATRPGRQNAP